MIIGQVPCNGCTRCCHGDAVRLMEGEREQFLSEPHEWFAGELMIAHKPDGDCVYLDEDGCSIHDHKPRLCKEMDCRIIAQRVTFTQARVMAKAGKLPMPIWLKGRELLKQEVH